MDSKKYIESYFDVKTNEFINVDSLPMSEWDKYPRVIHTKNMKNFTDVKKYVKKKELKNN